MNTAFKSLGFGLLALMTFWSCTLEEIETPQQAVLVDPLPVAQSYYDLEKPKQGNLYGRIQSDLEVFPYWEGAKSFSDGQILIVPAHRKVKATYAQGYLRRLVFQLDEAGQVIRGGILEMSGKDGDFLLRNEGVLIEGFLSGVKSSNLTYLWSDFGSNPLDAVQANGKTVERSIDRLLNSKRDFTNFSFDNCIDWYWVYSVGGVVVYEEYSHTTCGSGGCGSGLRTNSQDACLDDGTGSSGGGDGAESPGDQLCKNTFANVNQGSANSFFEANLNGLKFENGNVINQFNLYFSLANGISDFTMNKDLPGNIVNTNGGESPIDYILDISPYIIQNGDLYFQYENGQKYWYFTKNGAQEILRIAANLAAFSVNVNVPYPASNSFTKQYYVDYFRDFLKVFAPGSTVNINPISGKVNIYANYSSIC